jgi:hypothetical protein
MHTDFKQQAKFSKKTMEFGYHFKNGASPKSLTSRGKQLINLMSDKEQT